MCVVDIERLRSLFAWTWEKLFRIFELMRIDLNLSLFLRDNNKNEFSMEIKEIKFLLKKVDEFDAIKVFLFTKNCVRKRERE